MNNISKKKADMDQEVTENEGGGDIGAAGNAAPEKSARPPSTWVRKTAPVGVVLIAIAGAFLFGLDDYLSFDALARNRQALLAMFEQHAVLSVVLFIMLYTAVIALSLPGAVWLSIAGGFLFGTWFAMLWNIVGATAGAVLIFLAARYALADFFHAKVGHHMRKMERDFQENAFNYLLVLRLVPLFPFWLVNLVPALLNVRLSTYTAATVIGIIPGAYVFSSIGNGAAALIDEGVAPDIGVIFRPEILMPLIGLAVLSLIPVLYRKYQRHAGRH